MAQTEIANNLDGEFETAKQHLQAAIGASFVAVGDALLKMRVVAEKFGTSEKGKQRWEDKTGCRTFAEFVRLEFQMVKSRAWYLMEASKIYHRLEGSPLENSALPVNERQCRWLTQVPPKRLPAIWSKITEQYEAKRAESVSEGKKVSKHPPASFIVRYLSKKGLLTGDVPAFIAGKQDSRLVARTISRLNRVIEAFEQYTKGEQSVRTVAEKEQWTPEDKEQLLETLDEVTEWTTRIKRSLRSLEL